MIRRLITPRTKQIFGSVAKNVRTIVTRELLVPDLVSLEHNYFVGNTIMFKQKVSSNCPVYHLVDIKKYATSILNANEEMLLVLEDFDDTLRPNTTTFWLAPSFLKEAYYSGSLTGFHFFHTHLSIEDAMKVREDLTKLIDSRSDMLDMINQEIVSKKVDERSLFEQFFGETGRQ